MNIKGLLIAALAALHITKAESAEQQQGLSIQNPENLSSGLPPFTAPEPFIFSDPSSVVINKQQQVTPVPVSLIDLNNPSDKQINRMLQQAASCIVNTKIVFDGSGSQDLYPDSQKMVSDILDNTGIAVDGSSSSVTQFADGAQSSGTSSDLSDLKEYTSSLVQPGGGTELSTALQLVYDQIINDQTQYSSSKPLVVPILTDFVDDYPEGVQSLIAKIQQAVGAENVRFVYIAVEGVDGIGTDLLNEIYRPGIDSQFVFLNPNAINNALADITNIMQAVCGVTITPAPSSSPTTTAPSRAPSSATTGAPSRAPVPATTGAPSRAPTQAVPPIGADICGIVCLAPLILLAPGVRKKKRKQSVAPTPMSSDNRGVRAQPTTSHTVKLDPASRVAEVGRTTVQPTHHDTYGIPLTSNPTLPHARPADRFANLPGEGETRHNRPPTPPVPPEPPAVEGDKETRYFASLLIVSLAHIALNWKSKENERGALELEPKVVVQMTKEKIGEAVDSAKKLHQKWFGAATTNPTNTPPDDLPPGISRGDFSKV